MNNFINTSLASELPYWEFFDGPRPHAILFDGSIIAGVQASLVDIECWDSAAINHLTEGVRSSLNSISEGLSVQFYLRVGSDASSFVEKHKNGFNPSAHPLIKKIAQKRESGLQTSLESGEFYKPELFIFLKTPMLQGQKFGLFKRPEKFAEASRENYEETVEMLFQNLDTLISSLGGLGIKSRPLSKSELVEIIYRFLNPKRSLSESCPKVQTSNEVELESSLIQEVPWMAQQSPREQLVFGDLILEFSHFVLDSYLHKVITLKTLPEITFAGQLANFLRLPFHYDLLLSVDIPEQASEMAKLQQKRKMAHSLAATSGGRASDLESETKLSSTEELIRELLSSGQRIYAAQMSIVLRAPVGTDGMRLLSRQAKEVLSRLRALQGAEGLEESVGAWKVIRDCLPLAPLNLERARRMKTNNLADFLPLYGPRMGDDDPVVIFKNRLGGLVGYNPFDPRLPNYNTLVTGSSGAGKSFLNNCILLQEMARSLRVFVIDIGGSYKKITQALDGQYLEINLSDQYRLNPFDIADIEEGPTNQKLKSLLAAIESMVTDEDKPKLAKLDRVLLEKEIIELYKKKAKENKVPTLSDLVAALEKSKEQTMQILAKLLYTWTGDRPYGRLLDGYGGLRADSTICTFDLKGLSSYPDLQSVMIIILTDFILGQVENDRSCKKRIIMDEAWALLQNPASAGFMEYCARTLRKTGSGITFITQGVEEIAASSIGPAILNNTATKFILLQRGDPKILKDTLRLNSQEISLIGSLEQRKGKFSEGFLMEGDEKQVVQIRPGPFEYWLSTSDAEDNKFLAQRQNDGLSLIEAIEEAVVKHPNGVGAKKAEAA
ncbi:MAG: hypothetical protein A2504_13040 [Bdellovibrionales bacterium RIFOXYD12_FULL_39_22]|nr:MAG: hypothetical protein A2385_00840 [Bdellovibrionales bacterium RIFOXYB1_FULL_39_21]OFZ43554.1 MAG: hypothetical protein A2485_12510 [Bdellovibrionales bacterium RIFOXYC12_FULL_39_17]OFZ44573.1 MAG: hypothetical protein A2404_10200 [Bdellovibrionales bacterium RIFOXYC1_FULL_39_130]OFZ76332.1 MAG: hypothetical protein A2560_06820 [Bdellovibrionales bacterium RIFOXYD1_FULL_39_84]OFZ94598.1 MAG: hypothetical protein A2504_13040 [Bdellovibrionales bacterium RIFOXYD12_FULL_39_22]HLE12948.1 Tr